MIALQVLSMGKAAGKTTLCAGLAGHWLQAGRKVGYVKPNSPDDGDAVFLQKVLGLEKPPALPADGSLLDRLRQAWAAIAGQKDLVLVEGSGDLIKDGTKDFGQMADAMDARVLIVVRYFQALSPQDVASVGKEFGSRLIGVVINAVPQRRISKVRSILVPAIEQEGIKVLAVLPDDRLIYTVSVRDLAEAIQGQLVLQEDHADELVESIMIGANSLDPGTAYFAMRTNKAVITRGDRPDIALAALDTSLRCLILSAGVGPNPYVTYRAEEGNVPVIVTEATTISAMEAMGKAFQNTRFRHEKKLPRLQAMLEQGLDFAALDSALGLS